MMQLDANNELFGEVLKVLNNISPTCQTVLKFMDKVSLGRCQPAEGREVSNEG